MILTPEILTIYILNALFLFFTSIAFFHSVKIVLNWDAQATTNEQYQLEKRSYLASTIIRYIFMIKVPLFIFFIFTVDKISLILPGAMCGAGVVNASEYGTYLLLVKLLNLYLFAYWIVLDSEDMKLEAQPYIKTKFLLFCFAFFLFLGEVVLETVMFYSIDVKEIVDCCGAIFSSSDGTYMSDMLGLSPLLLLSLFYTNYILMFISKLMKQKYLFAILNLFFIVISLVSLISFFGTYIYELPTHNCPFCFLQQDYNYIGYFLYALLFVGTFYGLVIGFVEFSKNQLEKYYRLSLYANFCYIVIVSAYPIIYFIRNGVWL